MQHRVRTTGPQAPQVTKKGLEVVKGEYTVEFTDYETYMRELAERGGFVVQSAATEKAPPGDYVGGVAALNLIARMTGGEGISEDELRAARAARE